MKTLGLFYCALGKGGIERGASFQIPMFRALGWKVVVFTNLPADKSDYATQADFEHVCLGEFDGDAEKRRRQVADAVRDRKIDFAIHHDAYIPESVAADLKGVREAGAKSVVFWHSVFSHFLLRRGRQLETRSLWEACRLADAVVTLTRTDATFFRLMGMPAVAIPYSDPDLMKGFARSEWPKRIVWMGRFVDLKRPLDALSIFEIVHARHPDAELLLLGDGDEEISARMRAFVSARPELVGAVRFAGFQNEVRPYLEQAGVGLVTSRFEGYSHAVVEMKMASLPVVAYAMPWLDTLKDGSGAVCVPQGDVAAAAEAVSALFDDPARRQRLGAAARTSYAEIVSTDQEAAYRELFERVGNGRLADWQMPEPPLVPMVVRLLCEHADQALRLLDGDADVRAAALCDAQLKSNRSYRLGRVLSFPVRMARNVFRRTSGGRS